MLFGDFLRFHFNSQIYRSEGGASPSTHGPFGSLVWYTKTKSQPEVEALLARCPDITLALVMKMDQCCLAVRGSIPSIEGFLAAIPTTLWPQSGWEFAAKAVEPAEEPKKPSAGKAEIGKKAEKPIKPSIPSLLSGNTCNLKKKGRRQIHRGKIRIIKLQSETSRERPSCGRIRSGGSYPRRELKETKKILIW